MSGKPEWGTGPWDDEPDRKEWQSRGFPCLARRNIMGAWCGYVAVPPGHPWHGKDIYGVDVNVHGGPTYAAACDGEDICHKPPPGEPDDVWWIGFDCAHAGDLIPGLAFEKRVFADFSALFPNFAYRDLAYVCAEVESLAEQAEAARE